MGGHRKRMRSFEQVFDLLLGKLGLIVLSLFLHSHSVVTLFGVDLGNRWGIW